MGFFAFRSTSRVTTHTFHPKSGKGRSLTYRVVFLEPAVERTIRFGRGNRVRFVGEFEGVPLQGAWQSAPGKGHYVMLSEKVLTQAERDVGDEATLSFNVVADDFVEMPDDVSRALAAKRRLEKAWAALTPSQQRAHLAHLDSAKTATTRSRRLAELLEALS
jgi:Bacteriocin-protection, YdeI or OmpD-Associated